MEKIKQEFVLRRIAGENVLIPVGNQGDKFQGIITLNETGRFIWEKLEEGKNLEEIAETITEVYISDKLTILHGQSDHLSRRFRSLISERDSRRSKSFL